MNEEIKINPEVKLETKIDEHGVKWFRYPGTTFWQRVVS